MRAIKEFPTPTSMKNIQQFLGLCSYFRKFIRNYAIISIPLGKLIRKNTTFVWQKEQEDCFQKLKEILTKDPILAHPNFDVEFIVTIDASKNGLGAVLSQILDGKERVIAYASRLNKQTRTKLYHIRTRRISSNFCH